MHFTEKVLSHETIKLIQRFPKLPYFTLSLLNKINPIVGLLLLFDKMKLHYT